MAGNQAALSTFLAASSELAGPDAGAIGLIDGVRANTFPGVAADWVAVRSMHAVASDFAIRALSPYERSRASAVLAIAAARLVDNLNGGQPVRQDDFFGPGGHSAGDEFVESVLVNASRDPEHAKLPHYGALIANVACSDRTLPAHAILIARLAAELSYRQFILIAMIGNREKFRLRNSDFTEERRVGFGTVAVLHELADLERRGLALQQGGAISNPRDLVPSGLTPVGLGEVILKRLNLNRVDNSAVLEMAGLLE